MAFQEGNTFVFGEQPSASKMDQLWRNDDALYNGDFAAGAIGPEDRSGGTAMIKHSVSGTGNTTVSGLTFAPRYLELWELPSPLSSNSTRWCYGIAEKDSGAQYGGGNAVRSSVSPSEIREFRETKCIIFVHTPAGGAEIEMEGSLTSFNSDGATFNIDTFNAGSAVDIMMSFQA